MFMFVRECVCVCSRVCMRICAAQIHTRWSARYIHAYTQVSIKDGQVLIVSYVVHGQRTDRSERCGFCVQQIHEGARNKGASTGLQSERNFKSWYDERLGLKDPLTDRRADRRTGGRTGGRADEPMGGRMEVNERSTSA